MKKAKPVLVLVLKLVVSVGLLAYFLARIHIERFLQTFANAKFSYIALVMLVYLFTQGISAARWTTLARPLRHQDAVYSHAALLFDRHVL